MARRLLTALFAIAGLSLLTAPLAQADWERVTGARGGAADDQVALARSADGVLHVAWTASTGRNTRTLSHTAIAADGTVGETSVIARDWLELHDPALVVAADGLRVFFGGLHTSHPDEPNTEINTALSVDGGATWALRDGSITQPGPQAYGSDVSAALQADGAPLVAWAGEAGTFIHRGLEPAAPYADLQGPLGARGWAPGVAANAGRTVVAWYSSSPARGGVQVQDVDGAGAPSGGAIPMPGTTTTRVRMPGRTPVVARPGGGLYVAYAAGSARRSVIRVWVLGAAKAPVVASAAGGASATLTAAADGRLWLAWTQRVDGREQVMVRRSNAAAKTWGATVDAGRPEGLTMAHAIDGSDAGGALDLTAAYGRSDTSRVSTYATRVLPGLTIERSGSRITVTDAGDPVPGVRVSAGGRSARTDERGQVTLSTSGVSQVRATARGYTPATLSLG